MGLNTKQITMNKKELSKQLFDTYHSFIEYINSLTEKEFTARINDKWAAGQQLEHILKSTDPLAQILGLKEVIVSKFGVIDRPILSEENIIKNYTNALAKGGKAPKIFEPDNVAWDQKEVLNKRLSDSVDQIIKHLEQYDENELDSLVLKHPLLGKMTIREMLCFSYYHVNHHRKAITHNLSQLS